MPCDIVEKSYSQAPFEGDFGIKMGKTETFSSFVPLRMQKPGINILRNKQCKISNAV